MSEEWTRTKWDTQLWKIAEEAAKSRMEKKDLSGYSQSKIDAIQRELERTAKKQLDKDFPFSKLKDTEKNEFLNWKGEEAGNYLLGGGTESYRNSFNPLAKKKMDDFAKLGPLVLGLADEGRDWYSMGAEDLFAEGKRLGYDTSSKKGKMDFLRDVGDVQQAHERGKLLEEFNKESNILTEMYYPTMMEEMRKQISTGQGSTADVVLSGALDAAVNRAMAAAPLKVTNIGSLAQMPIRGAMASALLQGALEGGRQVGKTLIDDELEADLTPVALATTLGATRPGMIGTVSTVAQQVPTSSMNRFARGVAGATRRGNPTYMERNAFEEALEMLMGKQKRPTVTPTRPTLQGKAEPLREGNLADQQAIQILSGPQAATYTLPEIANARRIDKAVDQLEALYGTKKAKDILDKVIDKGQTLKDYDNLAKLFINRDKYNAARQLPVGKELVNGELREGDVLTKLEQAFPSKMAEAYGNDKWYKAGLRTGDILGTLGGSIEPVLKVNPLGPLSGGNWNIVGSTDYKETKWYKSLSKKQQEAFDDAYQKSKKKESE